jgi:hypothetical protein
MLSDKARHQLDYEFVMEPLSLLVEGVWFVMHQIKWDTAIVYMKMNLLDLQSQQMYPIWERIFSNGSHIVNLIICKISLWEFPPNAIYLPRKSMYKEAITTFTKLSCTFVRCKEPIQIWKSKYAALINH